MASMGMTRPVDSQRNKVLYSQYIIEPKHHKIITNNNPDNNDDSDMDNIDNDSDNDAVETDSDHKKRKIYKKQHQKTVIRFCDLDNATIKTTTGFSCVMSMISFIIIINDEKPENIINTVSKLTWLEEYLLYFEIIYGKQSHRWIDIGNKYKVSDSLARKIFDSKLRLHKQTMKSWPLFVNFDEDKALRKDTWNEKFENKRLIFWDTTNVPLAFKPTSADIQRNTYSVYYSGNVAKGRIFIKPCGWIGTSELFVRAISDTDYFQKAKILETQQSYLTTHDNNNISWTIVCDQGFLITLAAFRCGGQIVIQPTFSRGYSERFTDIETLFTGGVARDRSGNERAVRNMKLSGYITDCLLPNESVDRMADVWLCWGFQTNFLYRPTH
jgi:hypothetical protein